MVKKASSVGAGRCPDVPSLSSTSPQRGFFAPAHLGMEMQHHWGLPDALHSTGICQCRNQISVK